MDRRVDLIEKSVVADTCAVWNLLSSLSLFRACVTSGFEFAITDFVRYECLAKSRKAAPKPADEELQARLRSSQREGRFRSYSLAIEDLQEVAVLEARQRVSKGELSAIAFAKRVRIGFQTDDQKARKLATAVLEMSRVQTTPHVLGWLFFHGHLFDHDLSSILEEHARMRRPLQQYFEEMYTEALRCRALDSATPSIDSTSKSN